MMFTDQSFFGQTLADRSVARSLQEVGVVIYFVIIQCRYSSRVHCKGVGGEGDGFSGLTDVLEVEC